MKSTLLTITILLLISGCSSREDHQLISEGGKVYRINKSSGELYLIEGNRLISLKEPIGGEDSTLSKIKEWNPISLPTKDPLNISLKTIWREDKLYYRFQVAPLTEKLKDCRDYFSSKTFTLELMDKNGFDVLKIPIQINAMIGEINYDGNTISISCNENIPCTAETYRALYKWTCTWNF